jgi:Domain of unknown function (DUF4136)
MASECQVTHRAIERSFMNIGQRLLTPLLAVILLTTAAFAEDITVDYNHSANFGNYHTYSWQKVETANSIWDARVKDAVNKELAAKGWTQVPSGGDVALVAVETTHNRQQFNTFYDNFGGRRFGGFGDSTTTVENYRVGTLVVDMFDAGSKNLIWRGTSSGVLSGNPEKNTKNLDKGVQKLFSHFPPTAKS